VIKVGTSVVTKSDGTLDSRCMQDVARQCCEIMEQGRMVTVVTSGAIGSGVKELGLKELPKGTYPQGKALQPLVKVYSWRSGGSHSGSVGHGWRRF